MITPALTAAVEVIMREASERAIMPHYQRLSASQIDAKAPDDVVTVADMASEALLGERLSALLPEADLVGEEATFADSAALERLKDRLCWIIDPLDGTNNFAVGKPPFGILIALADKGETLGGWILDCVSGRFCHAGVGSGAWIDGERVTAKATGQDKPIAAISLVFLEEARRQQIREHIAPHYTLVDIPRCAAEQYPRLVIGANDVSIFERTLPWDHAAGALFLNEAGGCCARPDGTPYRVDEFEKRGMIGASSKALFDDLAQRLAALD